MPSLDRLDAHAVLRREGDTVHASGRVKASLEQRCVATGDPLPVRIDEAFDLRFIPEYKTAGGDEEFDDGDETDEDEAAATGPARKSVVAEDEDDDDDMVAPDDVEADLDTILKDRLVAADDDGGNEDDEEPEERGDTADRLQPKRADEQLCSKCFLLVRQNMPVCPVGDDDCPLFAS